MNWLLARALVRARGFGGPHRGVMVEDVPGPDDRRILPVSTPHWDGRPLLVESTRRVRLGTRYPPSGSGEDYEGGGLSGLRIAVVVRVSGGWEMLSGDLRRATEYKASHWTAP